MLQIESADEAPHLLAFRLILVQQDGKDDVAADVKQHAPEKGVAPEIHTGQAEQCVGLEQADSEQSGLQNIRFDPSGADECRQQQGVKPGGKTQGYAGNGAGTVTPTPVEPPQHGRQKLAGGRE